jgi:adenylyltransferase/sulfurtransferase
VELVNARVAIVGVGGLGAPAAIALARAGVGTLVLVDDDTVDRSNLHRQILFRDRDAGRLKLEAAAERLGAKCELRPGRLTPSTTDLLDDVDVILECSDNYATKFLAADVARLKKRPIVHGAAIRWVGTAFAVGPEGGPCYRCLFEDIPPGAQAGCDVAGVVGPVCGIVGALQADLAIGFLTGNSRAGTLYSLDGLRDELRTIAVAPRNQCPLCGVQTIDAIDASRYLTQP